MPYAELAGAATTSYKGAGEGGGWRGGREAARDVGQAMARNPAPLIIPCHRVLAAEAYKIGGFSAPGGSRTKMRMLELEGVRDLDRRKRRSSRSVSEPGNGERAASPSHPRHTIQSSPSTVRPVSKVLYLLQCCTPSSRLIPGIRPPIAKLTGGRVRSTRAPAPHQPGRAATRPRSRL